MRTRVVAIGAGTVILLMSIIGTAAATPSPNGPGQPGAPNTTCSQYTTTPGHASGGQSPFNGTGQSGNVYAGNPGTASLDHSNSNHSVSQYDMACFQQSTH